MDKELLEADYRAYTGEKLFNLKRKPWIIPDEVDVATVVKVIDTCPSGALHYRHK